MVSDKKKVLIVDDSTAVINSLVEILVDTDYEVVGIAKDGMEALAKCKELYPDIVTLDIEMPKLDGIQALRILRRINRTLRVIMVTSLNTVDKVLECKNAGASQYIIKPFEKNKVLEAFAKV